ncbi:MAG: surface lipoprotein assembly modifier [Sulfitobacter sp.]
MFAAPISHAQETSHQTVTLSPDQLRLAAELNLRNGQPERALAFADALLLRDPNDVTALLVRAGALRATQDYKGAQTAARAGWKLADNDGQKYTAAVLMAQALSSDEKRTRAQFWLRRAAHVAPTPAHEARAKRDFRYVRQRNPWQTHLSFTLAPNSNINNGSSRDTSALLYQILDPFTGGEANEVELGAASKAISGLEAGFDLQTRYRFKQTERSAHDLRLRLSYRTYELSNSSKDDLAAEDALREAQGQDPLDITGSDFEYGIVQLGYGYKRLRADRRGEFSLTADIGQSFYGRERLNSYLRTSLGQSYFLSKTTKLNFGISSDLRQAQRGSDQHLMSLSAGISRQLSGGNGIYFGASVSTVNSESETLEYDEIRLRSGYVLGRRIMGTALQFGVSTSYRDYDVSLHDPSGRRDFEIGGEITATFEQIDYLGFNPTVSFTAETTDSNIGLNDVNRFGLSIGIASSF